MRTFRAVILSGLIALGCLVDGIEIDSNCFLLGTK